MDPKKSRRERQKRWRSQNREKLAAKARERRRKEGASQFGGLSRREIKDELAKYKGRYSLPDGRSRTEFLWEALCKIREREEFRGLLE